MARLKPPPEGATLEAAVPAAPIRKAKQGLGRKKKGAKGHNGNVTNWTPALNEDARKLAALGATDHEVADFFNVDVRTIHRWKQNHPSFVGSLRVGKDIADRNVIDACYKRAVGYTHPAVKIFCDPKSGAQQIVQYTEYYPPDPGAIRLWLLNRRPAEWKDKSENVITTKEGDPIANLMNAIAGAITNKMEPKLIGND